MTLEVLAQIILIALTLFIAFGLGRVTARSKYGVVIYSENLKRRRGENSMYALLQVRIGRKGPREVWCLTRDGAAEARERANKQQEDVIAAQKRW